MGEGGRGKRLAFICLWENLESVQKMQNMHTQSLFQSPQLDRYIMLGEEQEKENEERVETTFSASKRLEAPR